MNLTPAEKQVLSDALDALIRVHLGQVRTAFDIPIWVGLRSDYTEAHREAAMGYAERLQEMLTGSPHGGPSIGNQDLVSKAARQAYRLKARLEGDSLREGLFDENGDRTTAARAVEDSLHGRTEDA